MSPDAISLAETNLKKLDPKLGALITKQQLEPLDRPTDYFESLVRSIIGQQVSVAAARAIYGRFEEHTGLQPQKVLELDDATIKVIGLFSKKPATSKIWPSIFMMTRQYTTIWTRLPTNKL